MNLFLILQKTYWNDNKQPAPGLLPATDSRPCCCCCSFLVTVAAAPNPFLLPLALPPLLVVIDIVCILI
jgi:hypothetical protein